MSKIIRNKRMGDSLNREVNELVASYDEAVDGGSIADATVNLGIEIAGERITNGMARLGLSWQGGQISAASIKAALSAKIGAEVEDLSPEGIAQALNRSISYQIEEMLDVEGIDILNGGDIFEQTKKLALEAISSGRPSKLVPIGLMRQLKSAAAYAQAGLSEEDAKSAMNRQRQRKYRRTHKLAWVS